MADQSKPIEIANFQKGVGSSPYVGFGKMVGMEIFRKPGIIQPGVRLDKSTLVSSVLNGLPTAQISDQYGNQYVGDSSGHVIKNSTLIYTADSGIHDFVIATDSGSGHQYLIISKSNATSAKGTGSLDVYGWLDAAAPTVTQNWVTGLDPSVYGYKKMLYGQDNVIYIGNETKLASLVGFTYASPSINASALQTGLPAGRIVQSICELNRYIVISTTIGNGGTGNAVLYYMDRGTTNSLGTSFYLSIGVPIPERLVNQLINQDNRLYFFGSDTGTVYTGNITSYTPVAVIPNRLPAQSYVTYPNGVALFNNKIFFGVGGGFNSAYDTPYGLYALQGNSLVLQNTISSGEYGQSTNVYIGSVLAQQNGYYSLGWQTGTTTLAIDVASTNLGTNYTCWFESPFFNTAYSIAPRTFQTVQFNFGNNLQTGQGLKLYYRTAINAPWTLFATYTYASSTLTYTFANGYTPTSEPYPGDTCNNFNSRFPVQKTTNIQIKVTFNTPSPPIYGQNIELQGITLI